MNFTQSIKTKIAILTIVSASVFAPQFALAQDPDAIAENRKAVMKEIRAAAGTLGKAVKAGASQADLLAAADAFLASTDPEVTIPAFETNTHGKTTVKTTAAEKVWTDWDRFAQALQDMNAGAVEIQAAAAAGTLTSEDQLNVAMKECGFCHRTAGYRSR